MFQHEMEFREDTEMIDYVFEFLGVTPRGAIIVTDENNRKLFLPPDHVEPDEPPEELEPGETVLIQIPVWLAKKEGLI